MWKVREGQAGFPRGQFGCDVENGRSVSSVNEGALTDEQARINNGSIKNRYRWIQIYIGNALKELGHWV